MKLHRNYELIFYTLENCNMQYVIDDNYLVKLFEYDIILNVKNLTVSNASNAETRVCNGVVCI